MPNRQIVWLASYPKSGNTWVRLLLGNLLGLADDMEDDALVPVAGISSSRTVFDHVTGLNSFDLTDDEADMLRPEVYRRISAGAVDLQFIKAHDANRTSPCGLPLFPPECTRAAIYIVRDPLDVAVSYANHAGRSGYDRTVDEMNDPGRSISGGSSEQLRQVMLDWSGHYRSWVKQKDIPVCLVRYEDLRANTGEQLSRIAEFIGLDPGKCQATVAAAVEASRFERLQAIEQEKGFRERPDKSQRFFRSGRSGDGKLLLSSEQQQRLIASHADVMRELGYLQECDDDRS